MTKNRRYSQNSEQQQQTLTKIKYVTYPYFVARTQMKELPVYIDIKNGGTRILTEISRIEGDVEVTSIYLMYNILLMHLLIIVSK